MTETKVSQLNTDEATKLAAVLCQRIADSNGIPLLAIKGDAFMELGIRPLRVASDLDILVHPPGHDLFCASLEEYGWELRSDDLGGHYANHSTTYFHPQWPIDVDVHHRFPGFATDADEIFDLLWERRQAIEIAKQPIATVSDMDALIVQALNCLRNPWKPLDQRDFEFLVEKTPADLAPKLVERSSALSCMTEIKPYIILLDPTLRSIQWPRASSEWRARNIASTVGALRIIDIIEAPSPEKLRLIKLAIFPSKRSLVSKSINESISASGSWSKIKLARLRATSFFTDLPRTTKVIYQYYRNP